MDNRSRDDTIVFLGKHFFTYNINERMVREVLAEKNVNISRHFSLLEFDETRAQSLITKIDKSYYGKDTENISFGDIIKKLIDKFESYNKKYEEQFIHALSNEFNMFFEDLKELETDAKRKYYLDDYWLLGILERKKNYTRPYNDILDFYQYYMYVLPVLLPVICDESLDQVKKFRKINSHLFEKGSMLDGVTDEFLEDIYLDFKEHYMVYQFEKLVLPILALIWISPSALYDLLFGDWKPFTLYISNKQTNQTELISRLLPIAIADLMKNQTIPVCSFVKSASSQLYPPSRTSVTEDFYTALGTNNPDLFIRLNERFWDTKSLAYTDLSVNTTIRVRLKQLYDMFFDIGFIFEPSKNQESIVNGYLSIDVKPEIGICLLSVEDLKDPQEFIKKLQSRDDRLYKHIRSRLSYKMQNIILYFDLDNKPSIRLQQLIVEELNKAMMGADFYEANVFKSLMGKHPKVGEIMKNLEDYNFTRNEIIQADNEFLYNLDTSILSGNRYLLGKVFKNELSQEYSAIVEGWHEKYMSENTN